MKRLHAQSRDFESESSRRAWGCHGIAQLINCPCCHARSFDNDWLYPFNYKPLNFMLRAHWVSWSRNQKFLLPNEHNLEFFDRLFECLTRYWLFCNFISSEKTIYLPIRLELYTDNTAFNTPYGRASGDSIQSGPAPHLSIGLVAAYTVFRTICRFRARVFILIQHSKHWHLLAGACTQS